MKKIILLTAILAMTAAPAMAAALAAGAVSDAGLVIRGGANAAQAGTNSPMGKLSTGVSLGPNHTVSGYAIATKHIKGSKLFGTAHDSTAIFWQPSVPAKMLTSEVPGAADNSAFATLWTSM